VRECVPDGGSPAVGGRGALDLVRRRRRPEHEPLGERRAAQPADPVGALRPRGAGARHQQREQHRPPGVHLVAPRYSTAVGSGSPAGVSSSGRQ
jgi:hypothetical protein